MKKDLPVEQNIEYLGRVYSYKSNFINYFTIINSKWTHGSHILCLLEQFLGGCLKCREETKDNLLLLFFHTS